MAQSVTLDVASSASLSKVGESSWAAARGGVLTSADFYRSGGTNTTLLAYSTKTGRGGASQYNNSRAFMYFDISTIYGELTQVQLSARRTTGGGDEVRAVAWTAPVFPLGTEDYGKVLNIAIPPAMGTPLSGVNDNVELGINHWTFTTNLDYIDTRFRKKTRFLGVVLVTENDNDHTAPTNSTVYTAFASQSHGSYDGPQLKVTYNPYHSNFGMNF